MAIEATRAPIAGVDVEGSAQAALVERPRLLRRLEGSNEQVVLVNAAAGYGKSSLLAQWAAHDRRPFASVSLTEAHNDPVVLLAGLVEAQDRIEPVPEVSPAALAPKPDLNAILPRLEHAIRSREIPMVLVLDELEHISSADSLRLTRRSPRTSKVAPGSRSRPGPRHRRTSADCGPIDASPSWVATTCR